MTNDRQHTERDVLVVRRFEQGDADDVWRLHVEGLRSVGADAGKGPWDDDLSSIDETYLRNDGEFLVGRVDDALVTMGALRRVDDLTVEVKRMRVEPNFQRRGYGQHILECLKSRAHELGYQRLVLDTSVDQSAARGLYEKNGYREARRGEWQNMEMIYYEKML